MYLLSWCAVLNCSRGHYESDQAPALRKRANIHHFNELAAFEDAEANVNNPSGGLSQDQLLIMEEQQDLQSKTQRQKGQLVDTIESTISELGSMYRSLIHHISMQGETVERIDQTLQEAHGHVEEGQGQLAQWLRRNSQQRGFIIKLLVIVALLCMLLIIFVKR